MPVDNIDLIDLFGLIGPRGQAYRSLSEVKMRRVGGETLTTGDGIPAALEEDRDHGKHIALLYKSFRPIRTDIGPHIMSW